jgi:hypothetical protein
MPALVIVSLAVVAGTLFLLDPIPQDQAYHRFSDTRTFFGVQNALDVLSNLAFVVVGLLGIAATLRMGRRAANDALRADYLVFFSGILLTGFGSMYYHLSPSNETLVWDRLPMTLVTMGIFSSVIFELVSRKASRLLLAPLSATGLSSVLYWHYTESLGRGDLRFYALVQYLPILLISIILATYKAPRSYLGYIISLIAFYAVSRVAELLDAPIFNAIGVMSGHTLKHLLAAAGLAAIVVMIQKRHC